MKMKSRKLLFPMLILTLLLFVPQDVIRAQNRTVTYTVNSNGDSADDNLGDSICADFIGKCTLHAAIENANQDGQTSIIQFANKFQDINEINDNALPELTEANTTIDASNQWDTINDRPGVEIGASSGAILTINSNGNVIKGILFAGAETGIYLFNGNSNTIGGSGVGERNVFITGQYGVYLNSGVTNTVTNNYFGTITGESVPGTIAGDVGIFAITDNGIISDNLIVGYTGLPASTGQPAGIYLYYSDGNTIINNTIGVDKWGDIALGNEVGIYLDWSDENTIGPDNLIEGNTSHGIELNKSNDTTITNNYIGRYFPTTLGNGGDGIHLNGVYGDTHIEDNDLCHNDLNGLWLGFESAIIEGNLIALNTQDGIYLTGINNANSIIGGTAEEDRNVIGQNSGNGIHLNGASYVSIVNNYIGLRWEGAYDFGNTGHGILVENGAHDNTIGGTNPNEGNLIGYNDGYGIRIEGEFTHDNEVYGNVIGAPITWEWQAGNSKHGIGIYAGAHHNTIGSNTTGGSNIIIASGWSGVVIQNGVGNTIEGNFIGTDGGSIDWGNAYYGVVVEYTPGNTGEDNFINFNEIAFNGYHNGLDSAEAGVYINYSDGNMISRNSIHDNDGPGIKLVNGGNNDMPAPVINQAACDGIIGGSAIAYSWVQIFSDSADEGMIWEGTTQATGSGLWAWSGTITGPNVTTTARDNITLDTSAFSSSFSVGVCSMETYLPVILK